MSSKEKEVLESQEVDRLILQQGEKVLRTIQTAGWELIENRLKLSKVQAEKDRKKENRIQSTREKMLYWNGVVDGVQQALDDIYDMVTQAKIVEEKQKYTGQEDW